MGPKVIELDNSTCTTRNWLSRLPALRDFSSGESALSQMSKREGGRGAGVIAMNNRGGEWSFFMGLIHSLHATSCSQQTVLGDLLVHLALPLLQGHPVEIKKKKKKVKLLRKQCSDKSNISASSHM
jgi:hypothetical protein